MVSYAFAPPAGMEHVSLINLMGDGRRIEAVSCPTATTCTPVSPALALGDSFDSDFPAGNGAAGGSESLSDTGIGIGFRLLPSTTRTNPPVLPLFRGDAPFGSYTGAQGPANYSTGPIYLTADGQPLQEAL